MSISLEKYSGYDRLMIKKHGLVVTRYINHIVENDVVCCVNNLIEFLNEEARALVDFGDQNNDYETISYWIVSRRFATFLNNIDVQVSDINGIFIWHKTNGNSMNECPEIIQFAQSWIS
tara:strand:- start:203 stop:559 length:357 start_codon:yes stop_codon:yes gene_type:complete